MGWQFFDKYGQKRSGSLGAGSIPFRKSTEQSIVNTVSELDLLNGVGLVPANTLGLNKHLQIKFWGDWKQNSGSNYNVPRFKLKLGSGGTVILDTNVLSAACVFNDANRWGWGIVVDIVNRGAANSQVVSLEGWIAFIQTVSTNAGVAYSQFAVGEGSMTAPLAGGTINVPVRAAFGGVSLATIDTSVDMAVVLAVINPVAHASVDTRLIGAEAVILG
jgi:hypothetical protein